MGAAIAAWAKIMESKLARASDPTSAAIIECPKCSARMPFSRAELAQIDGSGFESYRLSCPACAASLAGVIDPYDETLLLSELKQ
jgi:hypothetical protein